jgi:hypothetical protein
MKMEAAAMHSSIPGVAWRSSSAQAIKGNEATAIIEPSET